MRYEHLSACLHNVVRPVELLHLCNLLHAYFLTTYVCIEAIQPGCFSTIPHSDSLLCASQSRFRLKLLRRHLHKATLSSRVGRLLRNPPQQQVLGEPFAVLPSFRHLLSQGQRTTSPAFARFGKQEAFIRAIARMTLEGLWTGKKHERIADGHE